MERTFANIVQDVDVTAGIYQTLGYGLFTWREIYFRDLLKIGVFTLGADNVE